MLTTLIDGLGFAEGLRWRDGKLWFSDFLTRKVQSVDLEGALEWVGYVPGQPSGLGFSTEGKPLVVSMIDRKVLQLGFEQLDVVADLVSFNTPPCNDMLVDDAGTMYVSTFSYELWYETIPQGASSPLIRIDPNGKASVAASDLRMPNGITLLPDRRTLVVAETHACRLTAFTLQADGSLGGRRCFAELDCHPDGICCDAHGDVWVSGLYDSRFVKVRDGGEVISTIPTPGRWAVACALGGVDGRRLFCATTAVQQANDLRMGRCVSAIEYTDVEVPSPDSRTKIAAC